VVDGDATARPRESVWDYPRPPRVEPDTRLVEVEFAGRLIARTRRALRVLETSHPPAFYLPLDDCDRDCLVPAEGATLCEWKGVAAYLTVRVGEREAQRAAWTYPDPVAAFAILRDHLSFYPARVDACRVGGEIVVAQAGDFYGGWITAEIDGPFKGAAGTAGW
jgi:uncharacterized protein (DUF427 family)